MGFWYVFMKTERAECIMELTREPCLFLFLHLDLKKTMWCLDQTIEKSTSALLGITSGMLFFDNPSLYMDSWSGLDL